MAARRKRRSRSNNSTLLLILGAAAAWWVYRQSQPVPTMTLPTSGYVPGTVTVATNDPYANLYL